MTEQGPPQDQAGLDAGRALKYQFLFFFVLSASGSLAFSFMEVPGWLPVGWAAAGMFSYLILARVRSPEEILTEDFADSFYYLGFLLTLVALVGVLLQLGADADDDLLQAVLSQFGLALVTTVIGLTGRVAILMFRPGHTDIQESALRNLETAHEDLRQALERIAAESAAFADQFTGQMETVFGPVVASTTGFVAAVESNTRTISEVGLRFNELAEELQATSKKMVASWLSAATRLNDAQAEMGRALTGLRSDREMARAEMDEIAEGVRETTEAVSQELQESVSALKRATTQAEGTVRQTEASLSALPNSLAEGVTRSADAVEKLDKTLDALHEDLSALRQGVSGLNSALEDGGRRMEASTERWDQNSAELTRLQSQMIQDAAKASQSLVRVREEIAAAVHLLTSAVVKPQGEQPKDA